MADVAWPSKRETALVEYLAACILKLPTANVQRLAFDPDPTEILSEAIWPDESQPLVIIIEPDETVEIPEKPAEGSAEHTKADVITKLWVHEVTGEDLVTTFNKEYRNLKNAIRYMAGLTYGDRGYEMGFGRMTMLRDNTNRPPYAGCQIPGHLFYRDQQ